MKFTDGNWLMRPGVRASQPWQPVPVGIDSIAAVEGGLVEGDARGMRVTPAYAADRLRIWLDDARPAGEDGRRG